MLVQVQVRESHVEVRKIVNLIMRFIFFPQVWDTVQAFCSSITGTLATQAVLKGAGVGDSSATAAGATITWLLKGLL